jgi:ATP-binding cassette, subfamily B, bacterial
MIGSGPGLRLRINQGELTRQQVKPGTARRIIPYAVRYRWSLVVLLVSTAVDSGINVTNPLILGLLIDNAILPRRLSVLIELALAAAGLALLDALATYIQTWCSARVGQGLVFTLRTQVFKHVQQQPLAFFTRAQTGSLVSRLNTDVMGAQQAATTLLTQAVSIALTLILSLIAMFYLSWQISLIALAVIPMFVVPGRLIGKKLQRLARQQMQLTAEVGSLMNERFNVAGAMLSKLYGRPDQEADLFTSQAGRVRDISIVSTMYSRAFFIVITLLAALITTLVYGLGGSFVISGTLKLGTIVALVALITRLYGPINQLTTLQINYLTMLVSFDRIFEVMDLKPLITESPNATPLRAGGSADGLAPDIEFDRVCFRYPAASEVSLPSLESVALPAPERDNNAWALQDVSFRAPRGKLTALVGPSGAGKTTITYLVPRLFDPTSGVVRIGGHDIRDATLSSLRDTIGVVTQDAHLFHDTIRANLLYARPDATEQDLIEACKAARIWDLMDALPDGLNTVAGDRGYRFSGGEKQRVALARLLLKSPSIVVLDEATAHLDSESEAAIQSALKTALTGRTSIVIAHRLSTIREADQILVVDAGQIRERGTHDELIALGGLYAELCRTQFSRQVTHNGDGTASHSDGDGADGDGTGTAPSNGPLLRLPMPGGPMRSGPMPAGPMPVKHGVRKTPPQP